MSAEILPEVTKTYFVVAQVKSNRVVYFTDDPTYRPPEDEDWFYISQYQGKLPKEMSLKNCWRWRFNGGLFTDAGTASAECTHAKLLDHNRKALRKILAEKIDTIRSTLQFRSKFGEEVFRRTIEEARQFLSTSALEMEFPYLLAASQGTGKTISETASEVIERAKFRDTVLADSETILLAFDRKISEAKNDEELLRIRADLLENVGQEWARNFRYNHSHMVPQDQKKELPNFQKIHERATLLAMLKTSLNSFRAQTQKQIGFKFEDESLPLAAIEAEAFMKGCPAGPWMKLLQSKSPMDQLSEAKAAEWVLQAMAENQLRLLQSEKIAEKISISIKTAHTLEDFNKIAKEINALHSVLHSSDSLL